MIAWLKRQNAWYWDQSRRRTPKLLVALFPIVMVAASMKVGYEYLDRDSAAICGLVFSLWIITFWAWTLRQWWRERP